MNTFDGWQLTTTPTIIQFDFGGSKCMTFSLSPFGGFFFHIHSVWYEYKKNATNYETRIFKYIIRWCV